MKIKEMFKKIIAGIGVFCATITSKVFAVATDSMPLGYMVHHVHHKHQTISQLF